MFFAWQFIWKHIHLHRDHKTKETDLLTIKKQKRLWHLGMSLKKE